MKYYAEILRKNNNGKLYARCSSDAVIPLDGRYGYNLRINQAVTFARRDNLSAGVRIYKASDFRGSNEKLIKEIIF